jgi:hypothetical protein
LNKIDTTDLVANQAKTEAYLERKKPTSEETEAIAQHEEVPKEETAVKTAGAQEDR